MIYYINGKKRCSKCQKLKLPTEFYSHKRHRDGLRSECKNCTKNYEQQKRPPLKNKEKCFERHRQWYLKNPEKKKEYAIKRRNTLKGKLN